MFAKNALRWALSLSAGLFWFAGCASEKAPSDLEQTPRIEPSAASSARNADALKSAADEEAAPEEEGAEEEPPVLVTSPPVVYTKENGDMIGVTRQGNEYVINPLWYGTHNSAVHSASWRAAAAEPRDSRHNAEKDAFIEAVTAYDITLAEYLVAYASVREAEARATATINEQGEDDLYAYSQAVERLKKSMEAKRIALDNVRTLGAKLPGFWESYEGLLFRLHTQTLLATQINVIAILQSK